MRRKNVQARVLRALSEKTQEQTAEDLGVTSALIAQIELDKVDVAPDLLAGLAATADLAVPDSDDILRLAETLRRSQRWRGPGGEVVLQELTERLRSHLQRTWRRLTALHLPLPASSTEVRRWAGELREKLESLSAQSRLAEGQDVEELQRWLLCEAACEQSVREASRDLDSASAWARLAREVAEQARGPEGARNRLRGYAVAHEANILRVVVELKAAESVLEEAKRLWDSGCDPYGVLDPGRLLHFEAALRREQRRFDEALALLDEAATVSYPERALVSKGFTLEVMGQYERAIETLLQAISRVDRQADPRLWNILRLNLATLLCHVGNYGEAAGLVEMVRPLVADMGDEIDLVRLIWLEGRVAAGQGRSAEARRLLAQARQEFAARGMAYDVALALLEEAVLLLDEGRAAEVKALAPELAAVFEDKGVHREALAALRLFHEAVECDEATAELAHRVLRFLFRARHDPELRFEAPRIR
jgi:tetratricopeptide (TPR) repeat protein/DNA-binding XRE family transcriptional regulator